MRVACVLVVMLFGLLPLVVPGHAAAPPSPIILTDVSHALEGRALTITGRVVNTGPAPVIPLVIDAAGFGPAGDLVASGSDGIPWEVRPGQAERFTIAVPLARSLIREYMVEVSRVQSTVPLASVRRGVDVGLYRSHLPTLIELRGHVQAGTLVVRAGGPGLPIAQVTAEATVLVFDPLIEWFKPLRLTLDLPPDGSASIFLGSPHAVLASLRLVDLRLKSSWSD